VAEPADWWDDPHPTTATANASPKIATVRFTEPPIARLFTSPTSGLLGWLLGAGDLTGSFGRYAPSQIQMVRS
jgi:hypothetical protein